MASNDTFAHIPLFATAAIASILLVLLLISRKRSTARVSFTVLIADIILLSSSLAAGIMIVSGEEISSALFFFSIALFLAAFLVLPYGIMLSTFEPKKIEKLVPKSYNEKNERLSEQVQKAPEKNGDLSEDELAMLDVNRDFMVHAAGAYDSDQGYNDFLDYINKTIKEQINADGAALLMVDDFEDLVSVKAFDGDFPPPYKLPSDLPHKPVRISTSFKFASFSLEGNIFGEIAKSGRPELIDKPEIDDRIYQNGPEEFLECGSYIIVPLKIQGTVIGVTAFARKNGTPKFTKTHLGIASTLTDFAAAIIKNVITVKDIIERSEMNKESEIAMKIQSTLRPVKLPLVKGVQLGNIWAPADGVCGDYYDVIVSRKDRVSFIMSDIAGKGTNSMTVMTMIRAMLRLVINTTQSAGKILTWVNKGITSESFSTDHFGSVALINYNPLEQTMEISTGGIIPVYYFDGEKKEISLLSQSSDPIGVEKTSEYKDFVQNVKSGDIIFTYTDGIVEALNEDGAQYTTEKLLDIIKANCTKPSKELANIIKNDVKNFSGNANQHDDESLLIIKIQ
ncbi:MAG: SpoIIE family protein phosphatase [Treponema sp.]|nr:SpoIIE family protein phosphatase [Treponema sp.]